jgi:1-phosphatidylinositol-3-phosphate 5-kinase
MLEQAIERAELPRPQEWHRVLSKLLLKVSTNVNPHIPAGDSMDVRAFVKVKKVPGGKISDSEYVDGIVITKNVAHKAMPRRLVNPRIMLLTFPLDFQRVENQFMSLQPILAQERNYLRMLTQRVIDVRPHIVLVERSASRIALEYLLEANVAVARSVKLSAIHQVARCTQADVIASMDRLLSEPRLGRCAEFHIQSFEHDLIPGRRKTLMRFEGCQRDFGCTLILRGGDTATLRKVKVVADFMALVAYHLKNEVILFSDEHNLFPPEPPLPTEYRELLDILNSPIPTSTPSTPTRASREVETPTTPTAATPGRSRAPIEDDERAIQKRDAARLTREIALSLQPYLTTVLSASAAIQYPPPAPLARVAELDRRLAHLRQSRDDEEAAQILQEETQEAPKIAISDVDTASIPSVVVSDTSDTGSNTSTTDLPATVTSTAPSSLHASQASSTSMLTGTTSGMSMAEATRDPYRVLCKPEDFARESTIVTVEHDHAEQVRLWEWYARRHADPPRPEDFQSVTFLASMGCEGQEKPCVEPHLDTISFYQEGDRTVGQYLENLAVEALARCPSKTCERLLLFHFRLFVHGDRRLQLAMDQFPCPSPGHEECIITWSYCRQCGTPSPTTILREETWRMSWGSYLEHCFYPPEGKAGFTCPHDAYRDQIRYFAHRNLAIRIHNESIDIYEPVRPSISLQVKVETRVVLKNREYENALQKNTAFFDSVLFRLRSFDYDIVQPEQVRRPTFRNDIADA